MTDRTLAPIGHSHVFLGAFHARNERRTWIVIALCGAMMVAEIAGGTLFGSLALVADGWHMSTHAAALLIAALAYRYARRHADDPRFGFGTGKLGDLAGFGSAIVLGMIALLIGYQAATRLIAPIRIDFDQAIPIAGLGLLINIVSAWLLSGGDRHEHREHAHDHADHHGHAAAHRDNNLRAAFIHVAMDGFVSVLAIAGLSAGKFLGWNFMDPVMGIIGAGVIANWSYRLLRDTGGILLDTTPDRRLAEAMRAAIEADGDRVGDLHVWRVGPGHLAAIVSVVTGTTRGPDYYHARLARFPSMSHVTVEIRRQPG
jgi:cation diffusion facilitator family transporter